LFCFLKFPTQLESRMVSQMHGFLKLINQIWSYKLGWNHPLHSILQHWFPVLALHYVLQHDSQSLYRKLGCHGPSRVFLLPQLRHNKLQFQGINVLDYII
jgi:hypothetical protein